MTLPASGQISLSQVNTELNLSATATISLNDTAVRNLAGVASGAISMSNLWGKSNAVTKGFAMGGNLGGSSAPSTAVIEGIDFPTEAAFSTSATLVSARYGAPGVNSNVNGYALGGYNGSAYFNEIDGVNFSTQTANNPAATLSSLLYGKAGVNSTTKGYGIGGNNASGYSNANDALDFSSETRSSSSALMSVARSSAAGLGSTSRGYCVGGGNASIGYSTEIDGMQYSTDAAINPSAVLNVARQFPGAVNSGTNGYIVGGINGAYFATTADLDAFAFSTETVYNPATGTLPNNTTGAGAAVNSNTKGYVIGGITNPNGSENKVYAITFSTEAVVQLSAVLATKRWGAAGVQASGNNL